MTSLSGTSGGMGAAVAGDALSNEAANAAAPGRPALTGHPLAHAPEGAVCLLRCLVVCDLADSTALIERLGDQRAVEVIRRHDRLVRDLIRQHGGQEIDKTDGFLSLFERPIQAVAFALACQRALRELTAEEDVPLAARIGVHVGEVVIWQNSADDIAKGAKPVEVEGLVKPVAARLMGLALPGQILLSGVAHTIAHRAEGELGAVLARVRWRMHGRFRFKGVPEPVPVFEVGEEGIAPLKAPAWTGKAHRETPIWRRPLMLAAEALVLLTLLAVPLWQLLRPQAAIAFAERDWVVIADLRNLTDDRRFDEALHEAFRIGLEQSRHVNVLSDLQVNATLERMQRSADTPVDRQVGAEIARREGARALILTTLSEVGGRVRFTAEVVDPVTQTTVYAESTDGNGVASVLPSVDRVNRQLRGRLGEALASVSQDSQPLEKVATTDFDALRAYSMGLQARRANHYNDALALLRQAINIDPEFGRARIELAVLLSEAGDRAGALLELHRASEKPERLTVRDRLYAEATIATLSDTPLNAIERWRLMANLYPDDFRAQGALGYHLWNSGNSYQEAIDATLLNVHSANPRRGSGHYVLGLLYLGQERYDEAIEQFRESEALGTRFENTTYASVYAVRSEYALAQRTLARGRTSGSARSQIDQLLAAATFKLDQGDWDGARKDLAAGMRLADLDDRLRHALYTAELSLAALTELPDSVRAAIAAYVDKQELVQNDTDPGWHVDRQHRLLLAAWLATRHDARDLANRALSQLDPRIEMGGYPILMQWRELVDAELLRIDGQAAEATRRLRVLTGRGNEVYAVHVALFHSLAASGQHAAALEQARWLASHRGRAYTELFSNRLAVMLNVGLSRQALLYQAEQAVALAQADVAAAALDRFIQAWPTAELIEPVRMRYERARQAVLDLPSSL